MMMKKLTSLRLLFIFILAWLGITFQVFSQEQKQTQEQKKEVEQEQKDRPPIKLETRLVSLDVTVTDQKSRPIHNLRKEDFIVTEDDARQDIAFFSTQNRPISFGLLLDVSGSMTDERQQIYFSALSILDSGTSEDEAFLMTFSDKIKTRKGFTTNIRSLKKSIGDIETRGMTALYDAIISALDYIQQGKHEKKALIVVTDGADNRSVAKYADVLEVARQRGVLLYIMYFSDKRRQHSIAQSVHNVGKDTVDQIKVTDPISLMRNLSQVTGGEAHFPQTVKEIWDSSYIITNELHSQYSLGYYPTNNARDGKWRRIKVAVVERPGIPKVYVRARSGYYAPNDKNSSSENLQQSVRLLAGAHY